MFNVILLVSCSYFDILLVLQVPFSNMNGFIKKNFINLCLLLSAMTHFPLKIELLCATFYSRARGLMLRKRPLTTLFLPASARDANIAVHTCFVFFPIDVYWLDEEKKIKHKETLRSFSFSSSHRARFLVETKRGLLPADLGDSIMFSNARDR